MLYNFHSNLIENIYNLERNFDSVSLITKTANAKVNKVRSGRIRSSLVNWEIQL